MLGDAQDGGSQKMTPRPDHEGRKTLEEKPGGKAKTWELELELALLELGKGTKRREGSWGEAPMRGERRWP